MRICAEFMREVFLWKGTTIVLCGSEHILGRTVKEEVCRIESLNVSGMHCTISRRVCDADGKVQPLNHEFSPGDRVMICIKDSSSNGTFVNNQKLQRNGAEVELQHGDIVSLVGPPEHGESLHLTMHLLWFFSFTIVNLMGDRIN
jgi:hypothetical protein